MKTIKINEKTYKCFATKKELIGYAQEIDTHKEEWAFDNNKKPVLIQGLKAAWEYDDTFIIPEITQFIKKVLKRNTPPNYIKSDEELEEKILLNRDKIYDFIEQTLEIKIINEQER